MTMTPADAALLPLRTDDDVLARVGDLVGCAQSRRVWLLFLDDEGVQLPVMVPIEGRPEWPDDDLTSFAGGVDRLAGAAAATSVVVVWERPGGPRPSDADRAWARGFALAFARADHAMRGQLLSHDGGVRWLPADDYL